MGQGHGRDKVQETAALECCVREALEAAAVQGLCHEGQVEAAVGALRAARPDLSGERALVLVQRLARACRGRS